METIGRGPVSPPQLLAPFSDPILKIENGKVYFVILKKLFIGGYKLEANEEWRLCNS